MALDRQWQYQSRVEPLNVAPAAPVPQVQPETSRPDRNFAARTRRALALVAMAPSLFFTALPPEAPAVDFIVELEPTPIFEVDRTHLYESFTFEMDRPPQAAQPDAGQNQPQAERESFAHLEPALSWNLGDLPPLDRLNWLPQEGQLVRRAPSRRHLPPWLSAVTLPPAIAASVNLILEPPVGPQFEPPGREHLYESFTFEMDRPPQAPQPDAGTNQAPSEREAFAHLEPASLWGADPPTAPPVVPDFSWYVPASEPLRSVRGAWSQVARMSFWFFQLPIPTEPVVPPVEYVRCPEPETEYDRCDTSVTGYNRCDPPTPTAFSRVAAAALTTPAPVQALGWNAGWGVDWLN